MLLSAKTMYKHSNCLVMNKVLCNIWFDFKTTHSKDSGYVKFHRENDRFINGDAEIRRVLLKWSHEYFIPSPDTIERNNGLVNIKVGSRSTNATRII